MHFQISSLSSRRHLFYLLLFIFRHTHSCQPDHKIATLLAQKGLSLDKLAELLGNNISRAARIYREHCRAGARFAQKHRKGTVLRVRSFDALLAVGGKCAFRIPRFAIRIGFGFGFGIVVVTLHFAFRILQFVLYWLWFCCRDVTLHFAFHVWLWSCCRGVSVTRTNKLVLVCWCLVFWFCC